MKIKIDKRITDEIFMEHCLNLKTSGYDPTPLIIFYAVGKSWHTSKLMFLQEELGEI